MPACFIVFPVASIGMEIDAEPYEQQKHQLEQNTKMGIIFLCCPALCVVIPGSFAASPGAGNGNPLQ